MVPEPLTALARTGWIVRWPALVGLMALVLGGSGCDRATAPAPAVLVSGHQHVAPHGGTAVELGHEEFHLELVLDPAAGRLTGYVLDGELEKFIRIPAPSVRVVARVRDVDQSLDLLAVANPATGEKVGDTAQFEVTADWLKTTPRFDARLTEVTIRGKTYRDVPFNFPKGNE